SKGLSVRREDADVRPREDIPLRAKHKVVVRRRPVEPSGLDLEQTDVETGGVADELCAPLHRNGHAIVGEPDAPREEHLQIALGSAAAAPAQPELEDAGALEEEFALLGKEQGEPCEIDHGVV